LKLPCVMLWFMNTLSLYLHIPFCARRCTYCDFNTTGGKQALIPNYLEALLGEMEWYAKRIHPTEVVKSIYFGGGTPSLLEPAQIGRILSTVQKYFYLSDHPEITLEANPGTISQDYFKSIHQLGVNRLSLGVQSADDAELKMLGRLHNWEDVIHCVNWARNSNFENISLDLIYGLPEQTLANWATTLEKVLSLFPQHLSLYSLTLEPGTVLSRRVAAGVIRKADDDLAADMLEYAMDRLNRAGYLQYEISNWAMASEDRRFESVHNKQYWRNLPYIGFGAGAHSCYHRYRFSNVRRIQAYINRLNKISENSLFSPSVAEKKLMSIEEQMRDTMLLGLRLTDEGVSLEKFNQRFGKAAEDVFRVEIEKLENAELIEKSDSFIRLTKRGRMVGNQAFVLFVED
jgi:oxygen-independent coproporphyrinogen-3 oxidase